MTNSITGQNPNAVGTQQADFNNKVEEYSKQDSRFVKLIGEHEAYFETLERLREKSALSEIALRMETAKQIRDEELASANLSAEQREQIEAAYYAKITDLKQEHADEVKRIEDDAMAATMAKQENTYKYGTLAEKKALQERRAANIQAMLEQSKEQIQNSKKDTETETEFRLRAIDEISKSRKQARDIERSEQFQNIKEVSDKLSTFKEDAANGDFSAIGSMIKLAGKGLTDVADEAKKRSRQSQDDLNDMAEEYEQMKKLGASDEELAKKQEEIMKQQAQVLGDELESVMADFCVNLKNAVNAEFAAAEALLLENKAWIEGRLQGSDSSYNSAMGKISTNVSMSPFVSTKKVIDAMHKAVEAGIAYNLEQRSFLGTISEKIANTFDAFDSNLTRLIRLQQADTTAARLGMEASLTKFFNKTFQDNSYLKDAADTISAAIIDANASMSRDMSASFEYTVQKWLGSLYSLGMDQGTLGEIAKGINYIATGDVTSLSSNTSLQTLFAMSASQAGLSYSDLLLNGLNVDTTNKLLESMVVYLKNIAENSDNQVVRAAYGDIFSLSMSDMKAISNLTTSDISKISNSSLNYSGMMSELNNQFAQQITRTTLGGMMNTLYENATFGIAEDLVSNPATYAMYKMLNFMDERDFDMAIPFINAAGFGLDLNTSVQDLLRLGLGVGSAMSLVGNLLGGLGSAGGMNLDAWGSSDYTSRGGGLVFTTGDSGASTSSSTFVGKRGGTGSDDSGSGAGSYVGSGSGEDMKNSSLSSATDDAEETGKITNKNSDAGYTMDDLYKAVIEGAEPYMRVKDGILESVYRQSDQYLHTRDSRMLYTKENYLRVYDMGLGQYFDPANEYLRAIKSATESTAEDTESILKQFIAAGNVLVSIAQDANKKSVNVGGATRDTVNNLLARTTVTVANQSANSDGLDVFVTNLESEKNTTQVVKFESTPTVNIPKETLVAAVKEALGFTGGGTYNFKTVGEILNSFYTGEKSMTVKTDTMEPVETLTRFSPETLLQMRIAML